MENILKLIKYYAYILIQYMAKALFFTYIYNWFVPVLFPVFPIIDKADHIYSDDTSMEMSTLCDIVRYLILFSVMYIIKIIMRI